MFRVFGCKEDDLNDQYRELNDAILQHGFYQYMDVYSYLPIDIMKRYRFLKNLQLICSIGIYRYAQGNYLGTITYIWKIPESEIIDEFQDETQKVRMLAKIHEGLPKYFTRQMKKNVLDKETPAVDDRRHDTIMHMPLAISIRDLCNIILAKLHIKNADDKHKVPIGESVPVSTGVRNHRSLSTQNNDLNASDHDFTKLSLTPSVIYNRQVFVSFKDTVFEPSSAIRHATEFQDAIHKMYTSQASPPILCLYTDGGPDHRCTYGSV
ncbi:hypothetical protein RhiirA5_403871 [Rhizophagus irregularis]|uniref:Uncharacterized protein n=1 Tax=Rhizophagus irregularis TaxID=588596 RepID=A0A2N0NVV7_9GLOM|nr:hypothetical protein RhiirA5_403871 [Rhizophagus irregularis]